MRVGLDKNLDKDEGNERNAKMRRIRVEMRGMEWECACRNQRGNAGNQSGNLSIVVEMT